MSFKPFIIHLTEVDLTINNKTEKRIISKFLSVIDYIERMNLPSSQDEEIIKFIESLQLKTYRGGNKRVIKRKLESLTSYLKSEHSLIPEGYYLNLGMGLGPGFGLAIGATISTAAGMNIPTGLTYSLVIGMILGLIVGIIMDQTAKKKGKVISIAGS